MKVSFVIPTFNTAEYLHPAVDSCLQQDHKDVEVVIVDDASTDTTPMYLAWLGAKKLPNVKIVRNAVNIGRCAARNIGNEYATGDIIAVCDADDLSGPKRASLTIEKIKNGAQLVHGAAHRMDCVGRDLGMVETDVFSRDRAFELLTAGIVHSTVAYTKEIAKEFKYDEDKDVARLGVDDFCFFAKLAIAQVKFEYIPSPIAAYRINEFGVMQTRNEQEATDFKRAYISSLMVPA